MRWTGDVASGDWIGPRLHGWGRVGSTVPRGFEAYARVFHPVEARRLISASEPIEVDTRIMSWAEVASARGTTWHPAMQWASVSGSQYDEIDLGGGWSLGPPDQGRLPLAEFALICQSLAAHTLTPADTFVGVWEGWGDLHPGSAMRYLTLTSDDENTPAVDVDLPWVDPEVSVAILRGPLLDLPYRRYVLLAADVRELTDQSWVRTAGLGWRSGFGPTPNVLWPADRAWFLATEIDYDSTVIGGSRALIDAIVGHPELEAAEVTEDTDLSSTADAVNPPATA